MPNWYTTVVTAKGNDADLDRIVAAHIVPTGQEDEPQRFDLNTFTPMPEILKGSESSTAVDDGLYVLGREIPTAGRPRSGAEMLAWPWAQEAGIKTEDQLKKFLVERCPDCIKKAEHALALYEATGHGDWYSWSCANWGTKWNTCRLHVDRKAGVLVLCFETAWSPPTPVLYKLRKMYPSVEFEFRGHDEMDFDNPDMDVVAPALQ
jgi:hypothetical protein